jgi:tripartite-type tricarboxylate transporter receptor subunit TctC
MFSNMTGAKLVHVPYKGGAQAIAATLVGDVQIGFGSLMSLRSHMSAGRLHVLAITAKNRSPAAPDLPTIAEAGVPGYEVDQWLGVVTGAKVPPAIVRKLNAGIVQALKSPDVAQRLAADGSTATSSSPEAFDAYIKSEIAKWGKLAKDARLVLN